MGIIFNRDSEQEEPKPTILVVGAGSIGTKGRDLLFNQEESDKALLADKRVRKMFLESLSEEYRVDCFNGYPGDYDEWKEEKLKELE